MHTIIIYQYFNDKKDIFIEGVEKIRMKEKEVALYTKEQYADNLRVIKEKVAEIVKNK